MSEYEKKDQETEAERKLRTYAKQISEATGMPPEEIVKGVKLLIEESIKEIKEREGQAIGMKPLQQPDQSRALLTEIENSGIDGIKLSEIRKKFGARAHITSLLESMEKEGSIVRGSKKGSKAVYFWSKSNYEKWKASILQVSQKPKKISIKDLYEELTSLKGLIAELKSYIDQRFCELRLIVESHEKNTR